ADATLGHDRDADRFLNRSNHLWIAGPGHTAFSANLGRDALQRHDRRGPRFLGDSRLLGAYDIHDDTAAQHLGQTYLGTECGLIHGSPFWAGFVKFLDNLPRNIGATDATAALPLLEGGPRPTQPAGSFSQALGGLAAEGQADSTLLLPAGGIERARIHHHAF